VRQVGYLQEMNRDARSKNIKLCHILFLKISQSLLRTVHRFIDLAKMSIFKIRLRVIQVKKNHQNSSSSYSS